MATAMAAEHGVVNQLLLAQEWDTEGDSLAAPDRSIIVDNGSWEGQLVSLNYMLAVSERHSADYIVLRDAGGDATATRMFAISDAEIVDAEGFTPIAAMQALTMEELVDDIEVYHSLGVRHVGLPSKLMYPEWDGTPRIEVLRDLILPLEEHEMKVHLLGLMERPKELLEIAKDVALNDFVVSVDTAAAFRWAMNDTYPIWGTQLHIPRWIWENLTMEDIPERILWQWEINRDQLEMWARGVE